MTETKPKKPGALPHSQAADLAELILMTQGGIVSRTLVDRPVGTVTLFGFDEGQGLSEHSAPFDAFVQVVEGALTLTIGGQPTQVQAGQVCIMPANVPHAVRAEQPAKMLLVMIRG